MTRDCLKPRSVFLIFGSFVVLGVLVQQARASVDAVVDFFADFDIEILHSVQKGMSPHHRSPASAIKPAGQDL